MQQRGSFQSNHLNSTLYCSWAGESSLSSLNSFLQLHSDNASYSETVCYSNTKFHLYVTLIKSNRVKSATFASQMFGPSIKKKWILSKCKNDAQKQYCICIYITNSFKSNISTSRAATICQLINKSIQRKSTTHIFDNRSFMSDIFYTKTLNICWLQLLKCKDFIPFFQHLWE